jgi:hypothetical protein
MEYHSYKHKRLPFGFGYNKGFFALRNKSKREQRSDKTRFNALTALELQLRGVYADMCSILDTKDAALDWEYYIRISDEADGMASLISWLKERSEIERLTAYE